MTDPRWGPPSPPPPNPAPVNPRPPYSQPYYAPPPSGPPVLGGPPPPGYPPPTPPADRDRPLVLAGLSAAGLSVAGVVLRLAHVLPSSLATIAILLVAGVGLRAYVSYAGRSAASTTRHRITMVISTVSLGVSLVVVVAALPVITRTGGGDHLVTDTIAHLWSLLLLTLIIGPARSFGWRVLLGMGISGFLALPALAYVVARPVVTADGPSSIFATAVFAPLTEEIIKALPIVLLAAFALRRRTSRPGALDLALLGAWIGTGFALYEDTQYGRGSAQWTAMPPFSFVFPTESTTSAAGTHYAVAGHAVWTALIGLGLGAGLFYRRHGRWLRLALPVSFLVAFGEHYCANALAATDADHSVPVGFSAVRIVTLNGWLSSLLLFGGLIWFARLERRALGPRAGVWSERLAESLWRAPAAQARTASSLARVQQSPGAVPVRVPA